MPLTDPRRYPAFHSGDHVPPWSAKLSDGTQLESTGFDGRLLVIALLLDPEPVTNILVAQRLAANSQRLKETGASIVYLVRAPELVEEVARVVGTRRTRMSGRRSEHCGESFCSARDIWRHAASPCGQEHARRGAVARCGR